MKKYVILNKFKKLVSFFNYTKKVGIIFVIMLDIIEDGHNFIIWNELWLTLVTC